MTGFERWLAQAQAAPYRLDLWQALRRIDAAHPDLPRLAEAQRPADEPVSLRQPASLDFPPAPVVSLERSAANGRLQLTQRVFGLLGPNGPLPTHLTELTRDRQAHHADPTLQAFLDLLTQRFGLLFYRAWAQAQPVVGLDRPGRAAVHRWLGGLAGIGLEGFTDRDALDDHARLHFAGRLARQTRDASGLADWCHAQFDVPLAIEQWCGHWMALDRREQTRLARNRDQRLGQGAVLGRAVWDVQHKFRIVIGPLRLPRFLEFLPGAGLLARLQAMVRHWTGQEFAWDLRLILHHDDVPALACTGAARAQGIGALGRTAWLGARRQASHADDLVIDVERTLHAGRRRRAAAGPTAIPTPHPMHRPRTEESPHE